MGDEITPESPGLAAAPKLPSTRISEELGAEHLQPSLRTGLGMDRGLRLRKADRHCSTATPIMFTSRRWMRSAAFPVIGKMNTEKMSHPSPPEGS
jgi:hypothetical protein